MCLVSLPKSAFATFFPFKSKITHWFTFHSICRDSAGTQSCLYILCTGQSYFHTTDLPETRFSEKSLRISQSETASYRRYPDVPVGQLATSLFTAGHPLEIRNELKTASNVFIIGSRWVWIGYYCQIECGLCCVAISVFLGGRNTL